MPRRSSAPFWFHVLCAAALAGLCRALSPAGHGAAGDAPQLAFWAIFVTIVEAIWKGVEVAGKVTLQILQVTVHYLWVFARAVGQLFREFGQLAVKGFRQAWKFLRWTYANVLKPAWQKFWKFVEATKRALERITRPLFRLLRYVRAHVLAFYDRFVRPVLDVIGVTRKALHVLQLFGLDWARRLDRALADLEAKIDAPFRWLLAEVNKVINVVNRVVTADGLFQRLALVQSIARDYEHVWNQLAEGYRRGMTPAKRAALLSSAAGKSLEQVRRDLSDGLRRHTGPDAALVAEAAPKWRERLAR